MDDIDLLPESLRHQSLSSREIVLPLEEALQVIDLLSAAEWALFGWEGWVRYPDGTYGHAPDGMGTMSIERTEREDWETYVQRSANFCRETMKLEQKLWDSNAKHPLIQLYFCLTATKKGEREG